jgi:predicted Zn-dependent peptidase
MVELRRVAAQLLLVLLLPLAAAHAAEPQPLPPNPFAGFASFRLANGLRVWHGHLPGASITSMAVVVPCGRDSDPPGRAQTAHLLEHVLLSDRAGRTEAELARELAARGGTHGGYTGTSSTVFPLSISTENAAWGVHWLYDVVAPRTLYPEVVERNREPVAIEIGARRQQFTADLVRRYLFHPRLLPAPFWRRELGIDAQEERGGSQAAGLAAITAADLQQLFETCYTPAAMTLVVVSGLPPAALQPVLEETFALLPWRPPPPAPPRLPPAAGESRRFSWHTGGNARVVVRYRIANLDARDQLRLVFSEDLLRHRLMERLRRGGEKTVYSVRTATVTRGDAALFSITAELGRGRERAVLAAIDAEIARLQAAADDTSAFYADRDLLAHRLRIENAAPAALLAWGTDRFADHARHAAFPDVGEYYAVVGPDSIAAMAGRLFTDDNRILNIARPLPVPLPVIALTGLAAILAAVRLYRRVALRPVDMRRLRFVARLRPHPLARLLAAAALLAAAIVTLRIAAAAVHLLAARWIVTVDSFVLPAAAAAAGVFLAALAALALIGLHTHKVLVFTDEVRLKSPTFRSSSLPAHRLRAVRTGRDTGALTSRTPLLPPVRDGVVLELVDGTAYLFQVREPEALRAAIAQLIDNAASGTSTALALTPAGVNSWAAD